MFNTYKDKKMIDGEQLKKNILVDMRVELTDEFDKNFDRKAFFTKKWKRRANSNAKGSLLMAPKYQVGNPGQWRAVHVRRTIRRYTQRGRHRNKVCAPAYPNQ